MAHGDQKNLEVSTRSRARCPSDEPASTEIPLRGLEEFARLFMVGIALAHSAWPYEVDVPHGASQATGASTKDEPRHRLSHRARRVLGRTVE